MSNPILSRVANPLIGYRDDTLTKAGVSFKTLLLFLFMIPTFVWAWQQPAELSGGIWISALIGGFVVALITIFNPKIAWLTAPIYAVVEGALLGGISRFYELDYPGLPFQAAGLTMAVFAVMWFVYSTGLIKVNEKFMQVMMTAMLGIVVYYIAALVTPMFGFQMPFIHDSGWMGITFSLVICGVAAFNFLIDFDQVDKLKGVAPKHMEWYCAFGLILTFVWLYLELLSLLRKLE